LLGLIDHLRRRFGIAVEHDLVAVGKDVQLQKAAAVDQVGGVTKPGDIADLRRDLPENPEFISTNSKSARAKFGLGERPDIDCLLGGVLQIVAILRSATNIANA